MVKATMANHNTNQQKANLILCSWCCLIAGLILIAIYAAVFTASGNLTQEGTKITITTNDTTIKKLLSDLKSK